MIKYLNKGSVISFLYIVCILFMLQYPLLQQTSILILYAIAALKLHWLIDRKYKKIKDYVIFYFIFLLAFFFIQSIFVNQNFFIHFANSFKKTFNSHLWKEFYFFLLYLMFDNHFYVDKNFKISMFAYFYMIVEFFLWLLKYLFNGDFYFLMTSNGEIKEFLPMLKNFLYLNNNNIFNLYIEYSRQFYFFYFYFFLLIISKNFQNINFDLYMQYQTSSKNTLLNLFIILASMLICTTLTGNYPIFELHMIIFIIYLSYIQFIGTIIAFLHFSSEISNFQFILLTQIITHIFSLYFPNSKIIFEFLFGVGAYLLDLIIKIY